LGQGEGLITVAVDEGPCGCPLVDSKRTPAFWCNCSVGYQEESFSAVFGRPVQAPLQESKLAGGKRGVFAMHVGLRLTGAIAWSIFHDPGDGRPGRGGNAAAPPSFHRSA